MKTIQISALITLLSISSPPIALVHASAESSEKNDVIHSQEDVNAIVPSSNSFLRGAVNSAWNFIVASDGDDDNDEEDAMLMCSRSVCANIYGYEHCYNGQCCSGCSSGANCITITSVSC